LLDCARELLTVLSPDGIILHASAGSARVLGWRPDELVGRALADFLHADDASEMRDRLRGLAEIPKGTRKGRCRLRSKTGEWRWVEAAITNCLSNPAVEGLVASFLDVTGLHRMEAERQVISEVVHALNQTANLDQLLEGIHQALKKVLCAENCFVALHDATQDAFYFPFFVDQLDTAPPPQKVGRSCTAFVFRTGSAMLIPQSEFDRLAQQGEVELVGSPSPAWLGVPLKTPTATIGVLVVQHYENESAYDMRDLEFLDSVGGHIALAIERRRSEEALRKSESVFRLLFSHNPLPTWVMDDDTLQFMQVNDAAVRQYGFTPEEFRRMSMFDLRPEEQQTSPDARARKDAAAAKYEGLCKHRKKDGKVLEVEIISHQLDYSGRRVRLVVAQDISERHLLEQQLRQAQKMEAVGRLAGGVAHDFNNLLMVISGYAEVILAGLDFRHPLHEKGRAIQQAADRATTLTRQLLAFSRKQLLELKVVDVNAVVQDMERLLRPLIGENVEFDAKLSPEAAHTRADAGQLEQILMNLVVNAKDAMPNGGKLTMQTQNIVVDENHRRGQTFIRPGQYVMLSVSDTGMGMDKETQSRIFEPFFTTKEKGKGTGLGLSTVYGIVKQSGGYVLVQSEEGRGTKFQIYLPRVEGIAEKHAPQSTPAILGGSETVLLVEDEESVRQLVRDTLTAKGYRVVEAENGEAGLAAAAQHQGKIDLVITDVVMPGIGGRELIKQLAELRPETKVLYLSGYTEDAIISEGTIEREAAFLQKPFTLKSLSQKVREVLG